MRVIVYRMRTKQQRRERKSLYTTTGYRELLTDISCAFRRYDLFAEHTSNINKQKTTDLYNCIIIKIITRTYLPLNILLLLLIYKIKGFLKRFVKEPLHT